MSGPSADDIFVREIWPYWCIESIDFTWDQWALCTITCKHGRYRGTSRGIRDALGGSLKSAFRQFQQADVEHDYED